MIYFLNFSKQLFEIPPDINFSQTTSERIQVWENQVWTQICLSKFGYAQTDIYKQPLLEDEAKAILLPILGAGRAKQTIPTLLLSHDVDYLHTTPQMNLKRIVATKKISWKNESYKQSMERLVHFDIDEAGKSTFFVACPAPLSNPVRKMQQWLLDPSYHNDQSNINFLRELLTSPHIEIGLHGSFFSQEKNLLTVERSQLQKLFSAPIVSARQHWLNLPDPNVDLSRLLSSGFKVDGTIGWNGQVGFRGGVCRPLPYTSHSQTLNLVPLVLMDGPLFDDLKMDTDKVISTSIDILEEVFQRQGTVSIDWHERCAHPSYKWFDAYEQIVQWAKKKGFDFKFFKELNTETL